ncbi:High-affinity choline transporter 1 [Acipenser ruthenus]|uniref:High-affinity choline transporter 1 n=1 Tax=Acipenser ruthenus TaxID=7906 RepID=A0A444V397_ACIRT|nr:High-affinity choline transporter 1 [Acipenser ruthenus]
MLLSVMGFFGAVYCMIMSSLGLEQGPRCDTGDGDYVYPFRNQTLEESLYLKMAVNIPGLIAVIVFYILILATGIWASRKAKKEEKKCTGNKSEVSMVGGRNMNLWVGIFTTTAEVVYDPAMGLIWSTQPLAYALSLFVGGLFFAKPMRDKNYVTMMDPFQIRYGNTLMSLLSVPVLIAEVAWAANILAALDVIQLLFIFVSLWLCIPFLMLNPASTDIIYTAVDELYQAPWVGELDLVDLWRWLDDLLLMVFSSVCYQDFYQRVLATSSTAHAQKMCYAAAVFCFFLGVPSMLIGAIAASTDWNQTSYGLPTPYEKGEAGIILPIALQHLCPVYISIAGIGAIAAAVMSSMDSALLAAGSMFAFNIYKNMLRKRGSIASASSTIAATIAPAGGASLVAACISADSIATVSMAAASGAPSSIATAAYRAGGASLAAARSSLAGEASSNTSIELLRAQSREAVQGGCLKSLPGGECRSCSLQRLPRTGFCLCTSSDPLSRDSRESLYLKMAVNIPGLIAVIVFYILILATGIWASRKAKKEEKKCTGNKSEVSMVGGRNMNLWVGIFTVTATWVGGGYIMGTAELVYDPSKGLLWVHGLVAFAFNLFFGGFFFAKPMRDNNYVTMIDPFQLRYGNAWTVMLCIPAILSEVFWQSQRISDCRKTFDIQGQYAYRVKTNVPVGCK